MSASLNFDLGEEVDQLREITQRFAQREIAPLAAKTDQDNAFPMPLWRKFGELGVLGLTVEPEYGGTEMGYLAHVVAMEEISRASASIGLSYGCLLYTSPSPRDGLLSRMPSSA